MLLRDEPGAVGVGQQQVIELRQEAHRSRLVFVGPRRLGQIEQLAPALVAERSQLRSQRLENLSRVGQTRPRLQIVGTGRTECREVAQGHGWPRQPSSAPRPATTRRRQSRSTTGTPTASRPAASARAAGASGRRSPWHARRPSGTAPSSARAARRKCAARRRSTRARRSTSASMSSESGALAENRLHAGRERRLHHRRGTQGSPCATRGATCRASACRGRCRADRWP